MSGAAAGAAGSKFQAFMNHPAGQFPTLLPWWGLAKCWSNCSGLSSLVLSRFELYFICVWLFLNTVICRTYNAFVWSSNGYTGPKTVFFWAPIMKWCLVAAGLKDLSRPADKLSVSQNVGAYHACSMTVLIVHAKLITTFILPIAILALAATGFIWVRYSLVITPINYSLAAVSLRTPCVFHCNL